MLEQGISDEAAGAEGLSAEVGGGGGVRGRCLSPEDLLSTKDFVHGLATQVHTYDRRSMCVALNVYPLCVHVRQTLVVFW